MKIIVLLFCCFLSFSSFADSKTSYYPEKGFGFELLAIFPFETYYGMPAIGGDQLINYIYDAPLFGLNYTYTLENFKLQPYVQFGGLFRSAFNSFFLGLLTEYRWKKEVKNWSPSVGLNARIFLAQFRPEEPFIGIPFRLRYFINQRMALSFVFEPYLNHVNRIADYSQQVLDTGDPQASSQPIAPVGPSFQMFYNVGMTFSFFFPYGDR